MGPVSLLLWGVVVYAVYAWIAFSPSVRAAGLVFPAGLVTAVIGNVLWLLLVSKVYDQQKLVYYGMIWDSMVTASFILVPVLLMGVRLSGLSMIGCGMVIAGLLMMKIGATG